VEGAVTALLCRTSDRIATTAEGARALAVALAERMGVEPRLVGTPGEPAATNYDDDLREAHGCLLEAGGKVEDALAAAELRLIATGVNVLSERLHPRLLATLDGVGRLGSFALVFL